MTVNIICLAYISYEFSTDFKGLLITTFVTLKIVQFLTILFFNRQLKEFLKLTTIFHYSAITFNTKTDIEQDN